MDNKKLSPAIIEKKKDAFVARYHKEFDKCNKSAWSLAKVVFDTVNDSAFAECFGTMTAYADALGVSKASVTQLNKAYIARELVRSKSAMLPDFDVENIDNMTVGQWQEIASVAEDQIDTFIDSENVKTTDSVRTLREKVKSFKALPDAGEVADTEDEVEESDAIEVTAEESDAIEVTAEEVPADPTVTVNVVPEGEVMTVSFMGNTYTISDMEVIVSILAKIDRK